MRTGILSSSIGLLAALLLPLAAAQGSGEMQFDIAVVPGLERYSLLLEYPGYAAVALENNGLSPSLSSKLELRERGRGVEASNAVLRYAGRKGARYEYEAGLFFGFGEARTALTMPVVVDASALAGGRLMVIMKPPLAALMPADLRERIEIKMRSVANAAAQKRMVDYLDVLSRDLPKKAGDEALFEAILLDAYNRSAGVGVAGRDAGEALPLSDQWMLIVSVFIWLIVAPALLLFYRLRWRRPKSA